MSHFFFDHRPSLREARLIRRNFDMPGESFRGVQGNNPGIPNLRLHNFQNQNFYNNANNTQRFNAGSNFRNNGFNNRNFQNSHFSNFNVHNHQGWHFNQQSQYRNSFYWWNHQLPTYFCWEYRTGPDKILTDNSSKNLEGYRQDVLSNMSRMQQFRAEAVDRANRGLDRSLRIPNPYTSNTELAHFGARMGVINDSNDFERQFGYPVLTGDRANNPFEQTWDRYRGMVDRHWSSPRHQGIQQLHDRWNAEPASAYRQNQMDVANQYLTNWGTMSDRQRGQAYRTSMDSARTSFDVRGIQQQYLDSIMRQHPRQWQ